MFKIFPRKIGFPEQLTVKNMGQMENLINAANGNTNCYVAMFSDSQKLFGNLDKVGFDIDDCPSKCSECKEEKKKKCSIGKLGCKPDSFNSFNNMLILHKHYLAEGIHHSIAMSGGGYHLYGKVVSVPLKNPNSALKNYCLHLTKDLNIKADTSVFEIGRIMRFPGTFNVGKQLWYTWINSEDIIQGEEWILEKAQNQTFDPPYIWGSKKIDLRPFDNKSDTIGNFQRVLHSGAGRTVEEIELLPCLQSLTEDPYMNYRERYFLLLYLKEKGVSISSAVKLLEESLSPEKFAHCIKEERQPMHVYNNHNFFFPKCPTLAAEGLCVSPECGKNNIYL